MFGVVLMGCHRLLLERNCQELGNRVTRHKTLLAETCIRTCTMPGSIKQSVLTPEGKNQYSTGWQVQTVVLTGHSLHGVGK